MSLGPWSVLLLAEPSHSPVQIGGVGVAERTSPDRRTHDPGTASIPFHRRETDVWASQGSSETVLDLQRKPHLLCILLTFSYIST